MQILLIVNIVLIPLSGPRVKKGVSLFNLLYLTNKQTFTVSYYGGMKERYILWSPFILHPYYRELNSNTTHHRMIERLIIIIPGI